MATIDVKDAAGTTVAIEKPLAPARAAAASSRPVVLSTEDKAALDALATEATLIAVGVVLSNILSKISSDPATQTTLAAVLAKLPTNAAPMQATGGTVGLVAGAAVIGKVGLDQTTPGTTNGVVVNSQPARAATTDSITAKIATDAIQSGLTALTPKFAKIAASSSGNNALVAAVTSKKIRVLAYNLMANGAVNAKFQLDGAGTPTDLTGLKYMDAAGAGVCAPFNPVGWFETTSGKSLDLNLSGAVAVGGELVYIEV